MLPTSEYRRPASVVLLRCGGLACLWIFCFWIVASLCDLLPSLVGPLLVIGLGAILQFSLAEILNHAPRERTSLRLSTALPTWLALPAVGYWLETHLVTDTPGSIISQLGK